MLKTTLAYFTLPLLLLVGISWETSRAQFPRKVPPPASGPANAPEGLNPGPDVLPGNMQGLFRVGFDGVPATKCSLAVGITSCNAGNVVVNFFAMPRTDHPAVAQNLYRMSGGANNNERFEQIGQAWVKHTYGAKSVDDCGFGCQPSGDFTHLGVGCSDTYDPSQSADPPAMGSRAWINPFTGVFPTTASNHAGHVHDDLAHMLVVNVSDLNQTTYPGATYYAELQHITSDEYAWCQAHPGECNMYNNASYRQYSVTQSLIFSPVGETVRMTPAMAAWTGATTNTIEPEPGVDGRAFIASKVTGPVGGVWHYEYAVYNQNLDRSIQSFSVPLGCGVAVGNLGFHAPPNHPGFANDGTQGDAGFSNATWTSNQNASAVSWSTETFGQNQNANAIRWGTLYNFRFDSESPPQATNATIGFFKTGTPILVGIQGPMACLGTPTPSPTPSPTPPGTAQAINLSTRMRVLTGDNVGIGGFIITGTAPKPVLLRAIGPSLAQSGVPNPLADPVMELHGPGAFATITNDN